MDSKIVNREIRREIWPALKAVGFAQFTSRTAWRHSEWKIDVVNFQSFNSYLAQGLGCTTFSFSLNLGCYLNAVPVKSNVKLTKSLLTPQEYQCHLRRRLSRSFE